MIDPKSLRIGNKLFNDKKEVITVRGIEMPDGYVYEEGYDRPLYEGQYHPIPLSEQELIRLGFEKIKDEDGEWHYFKYPIALYKFGGLNGDKEYFIMYEPDVQFHFVHDLQNIYYDFKKEELTYKVDSGLTPTEHLKQKEADQMDEELKRTIKDLNQ